MKDRSLEITPVRVSPVAVEAARQDIAVLQELATAVLEAGVDYGSVPGIAGQVLFDPGAAKIMAAFNTYAKHTILKERDDEDCISFIIEASLVSRATGDVVATGVGAASTKEAKYGFRWVRQQEAEGMGFTGEALKGLTKRTRSGQRGDYFVYRVPNPERGELLNTLLKMSAKRAEQDAVRTLPGVGSALKKLFEGQLDNVNGYAHFWAETKRLGLSESEVHQDLGVTSVKQWEAQGQTLEDALAHLRQVQVGAQAQDTGAAPEASPKTPQEPPSGQFPIDSSLAPRREPPTVPQGAAPKPENMGVVMEWARGQGKVTGDVIGVLEKAGYRASDRTPLRSIIQIMDAWHEDEAKRNPTPATVKALCMAAWGLKEGSREGR